MTRTNSRAILHFGSTGGRRRNFLSAAVLMIVPVSLLGGCKKEEAPDVEVSIQAQHPEQGEISIHIIAGAVLSPLAQAAIVPKIAAPVNRFYVQRGTQVKVGQLLATLENTDLAAAEMDNK